MRENAIDHISFWYKEGKLSPELVSMLILDKIRSSRVDRYKLTKRPEVVISVPVCFRREQRFAARNALKISGLNVLRVFNEPAAVAFVYEKAHSQDGLRNTLID